MQKVKQIINIVIAGLVFNIPFLFPDDRFIMGLFLVGLTTVSFLTYKGLQLINK